METGTKLLTILDKATTSEIWVELAKRFGIKFGKIQMSIHDGRPSKYAMVDLKVNLEEESKSDQH